jgi:hypothetical protein
MIRFGALLLVAFASLVSSAAADGPLLRGTTGPDFTISLIDSNGASVKQLDPGPYAVHVDDLSEFHNFHLKGPGVDQTTSVSDLGSVDWQVTLVEGTYTYLCDVHPVQMKGTFTVGSPPPPPPPPPPTPTPVTKALKGSVGPGAKITFARSTTAGRAKLTIRDLSAKDNFHLVGPGVNKKTGVAFKGAVTWTVTLKAGTYTFRSDAHPKLRGTLKVS